MTAKVTAVRYTNEKKGQGKFQCGYFNLFEADDMTTYRELRQKDNDPSSGVEIVFMRDFIRKIRDEKYDGDIKEVHEEEIPHVYIEWFEKEPRRKKGDSNAERKEANEGWRD